MSVHVFFYFLKGQNTGPTLEIFLFPLTRPCFTGMCRSVRKLFLLTSEKLDTNYSKTYLKRPLNNTQKNVVVFFKTDYRIMQVKSIAECSQNETV